tara:strand:+ start:11515 stop:12621 length:1107 start_codon:yes stop_codon:yes gene_type:complete
MALVQMRTDGGSYSMVDPVLVSDYQDMGWTLTSDLPEFQQDVTGYGANVKVYNPDRTVTLDSGDTIKYQPEITGYVNTGGGMQTPVISPPTTKSGSTTISSPTFTYSQGLDVARAIYTFLDDNLLDIFAKEWAKYGDPQVAIGLTRKSSEWENQFGYLKRADGTLIMSELDAIGNITSYKNTLKEYNISDFSLFEKKFEGMVASGVSPLEFQDRIDLVYNAVIDDIPEVQRLYAEQYGINASKEAIFGALINKDVEDAVLANEITTLQLQAEGTSRGFSTSFARADELRLLGLDRSGASKLYESASNVMSRAGRAGRTLGLDTLESAAVGNVDAQQDIMRTEAQVLSQSSMQTGLLKKDGKVTGLLET